MQVVGNVSPAMISLSAQMNPKVVTMVNPPQNNALKLANKNVLVGVTGSIAAYKSADLVRKLREAGAIVRVAMTENAKRFITPLTMQAVSGFPVHEDLFDVHAEAAMGHIELARWADMIVVAPATADFMARFIQGIANDLLTTLCLATKAKIAIAPAMNQLMWKNSITQDNLQQLINKNILILEPGSGSQACGDVGPGRMMEPVQIVDAVSKIFHTALLSGTRVLITAGPTHEAIDPIRYISNLSSGKMGYALAQAAKEAGAQVTLISGPVSLPQPNGVAVEHVVSATEMYQAVMQKISGTDIFLSVAAVSDYRAEQISAEKIHKNTEKMTLQLQLNPDILAEVSKLANKTSYLVGFAAETENILDSARKKKNKKKLDMIIVNDVSRGKAMGKDENEVTVVSQNEELFIPSMPKTKLARELIKIVAKGYKDKFGDSV